MVRPHGSIYTHTSPTGKKVWKVEVEVGKKPDGTRKRVRRTAQSLREAQKLKIELLRQVQEGSTANNPNQLVGTYAHWWLRESKALKVRPATVSDYEHRFRKHIQPVFGARKLGEVTARDVTAWLADLSARGYSVPTINGALQVLKAVFSSAQREGLISHSPLSGVSRLSKKPGAPTQVREPLSAGEAASLLEVCRDDPSGIGVAIGLVLGLRKAEVLGLRWSDIDLEARTLMVSRGVREIVVYDTRGLGHSQIEINEPKTQSSKRKLTIPDAVHWRLWSRKTELEMFGTYQSEDWVISTDGSAPMRPKTLSAALRRFLRKAGVRPIRFHDLRHTSAVLSLAAGVRIEAVSQILGHGTIDITKETYAPYVSALSAEYSEAIAIHLPDKNPFEAAAKAESNNLIL